MIFVVLTLALVHYEAFDLAEACIRSIRSRPPTESHEIVIVDNGSRESALVPLRRLVDIRLIETGVNAGFAAGVNRCFTEADARSDVVIVLNPDTEILDPSALDALADLARTRGTSVAAPMLVGRDGVEQRTFYKRFPTPAQTLLLTSAPLSVLVDRLARTISRHPTEITPAAIRAGADPAHVMGAVMAISRSAWEKVGPFDEGYFLYLEETDWQERASRLGLVVRVARQSRVLHLHSGGDLASGVPSPFYVTSLKRYLAVRGANMSATRALMILGFTSSVLAFGALRIVAVAWRSQRAFASSSFKAAWIALGRAAAG